MPSKTITYLGSQLEGSSKGSVQVTTIQALDASKTSTVDGGQYAAHGHLVVAGSLKGHGSIKIYDKDDNLYAEVSNPLGSPNKPVPWIHIVAEVGRASATPYQTDPQSPYYLSVDAAKFATGRFVVEIAGAISGGVPMLLIDGAVNPIIMEVNGNGVFTLSVPFTVTEIA